MMEEVVHDYDYFGYHVWVVVFDDLADDHPITVAWSRDEFTGLLIAVPETKWAQLAVFNGQPMFLSTTRYLAQSFIAHKLAPFN